MTTWKLSAGTACVIGKKQMKVDVSPTTAYIMLGEKCRNHCGFCAQSQDSSARSDMLSRVIWPEIPSDEAIEGISGAYRTGKLKRVCLQVVNNRDSQQSSFAALQAITARSPVPICISSNIDSVEQARELIECGAERVSLALDAATPELFQVIKRDSWEQRWGLLLACAQALPGRISTHLIVGLGETEAEMVATIVKCIANGINVGLFAFTPLKGTAFEQKESPSISHYRRIQIAFHLIKKGFDPNRFQYRDGQLVHFGLSGSEIITLLADGKAFETSGCEDCNRPYYNERPGGIMYNYPRSLTQKEVSRAIEESQIINSNKEVTGNE
ncbi:MAG: radical SAM protein [Negativicutes bacterium]|nr:radical SAM protein [Negativicutes bacterium]